MNKEMMNDILATYAKETGKPVEELKPLLENSIQEAVESGYPQNENVIKGIFRKKISGMLWKAKKGFVSKVNEPVTFEGFIIGTDSLGDTKERMRRKALRYYQSEGESAKLEGYVDETGQTALDWRPTIKNRKGEEVDNPEYGKPILGNKYVRNVYGVVTKVGDEKSKPKLFTMTLWEGFAKKFTYRPFVAIEFTTTIRSEGQYLQLNTPRTSKGERAFKVTGKALDVDVWLTTAMKNRMYNLVDIGDAIQATTKASDPWILVEGLVDRIDPEINPKTDSRSVSITNPDAGMLDTVKVFIPKEFPIGFREYSTVKVFGKPGSWKRDEESEVQYNMNGISIFPVPGKVIETAPEESVSAEVEESWDLWGDN